jgi:hypothetical protein
MRKKIFLVLIISMLLLTLIYIVMKERFFGVVPDVAIKSVSVSRSEVFVGDVINITVVVKNEGNTINAFNVTTYYNSTAIDTQKVLDLNIEAEKTLIFSWNTSNIPPSSYIVKAEAFGVSGEADTSDNIYINGVVRVNRRTLLYIDSPENVSVGQNFIVNVEISDVIGLYGYEFEIRFNTSILEIQNVTKGSFLKNGGDPFFMWRGNQTEGYIFIISTLLGPQPGTDGSGTLAEITFKAVGKGIATIEFYYTKLRDNQPRPIPHIVINGSVKSVP